MRNESSGMTKKKRREEVFRLGKQAEEAGDYDTAATKYQEAVDLKYAPAELALGKLFYFGQGIAQDYEKAHLHLQKARETVKSKEEEAEALYYIAQLYHKGLGVEKHFMKAYNRLKRAADLGSSDAMYVLGEMWENGECEWNSSRRPRAEHWYNDAANAGNKNAMHRLAQIYESGDGEFLKDENMAAYWREQAEAAESVELIEGQAKRGDAEAMKQLGDMYFMGCGNISKDKKKAIKWYEQAAEAGNCEAMGELIQICDKAQKSAQAVYLKKKAEAEEWKANGDYWRKKRAQQ